MTEPAGRQPLPSNDAAVRPDEASATPPEWPDAPREALPAVGIAQLRVSGRIVRVDATMHAHFGAALEPLDGRHVDTIAGRSALGGALAQVVRTIGAGRGDARVVVPTEARLATGDAASAVHVQALRVAADGDASRGPAPSDLIVVTSVLIPGVPRDAEGGHAMPPRTDPPRTDPPLGIAHAVDHRADDDLLERITDAHVVFDAALRYRRLNRAAERAVRRDRRRLLGRTLGEVFPGTVGSVVERHYRSVVATGRPVHFATHYVADGLDAHVEVDAYPIGTTAPFGVSVFWRDVTARVAADTALRESEAHFRAVFEQATIGIGRLDLATLCWENVNEALGRMLGTTPAALRSTRLVALLADAAAAAAAVDADLTSAVAALRAGRAPAHALELPCRHGAGHTVWTRITLSSISEPDGGVPRAALVIVEDTTAARAAEEERQRLLASVERERARLAEVFRRAPTFAVVYRGPEHRFEYVNDAYYALIGRRPVLGRPLDEVVPEAREQGFTAVLDRVRATGEPVEFHEAPIWLAREPGGPRVLRYVDMVFMPLADESGATSGVLAQGVDVTGHVLARCEVERLLAETQAARRAEDHERRQLQAVLGAIPVGVIVAEAPTGRIRYANEAMAALWGHAPYTERMHAYSADWAGRVVVDGRPTPRHYRSAEWPVARCLGDGVPVLDERVLAVRPDGSERMVSISAAPFHDADGTMLGVVATVVDLEASFQTQQALEQAREAADATNRAKSHFLASMSHELRTPLNAIQGHVHLLALGIHGPVNDAQREALARVGRAQEHLLGLIGDVLTFAKLDAATLAYALVATDLRVVLDEVTAVMAPAFALRGVTLDVLPLPADSPAGVVWADGEKLRQVLRNLLSNAAKFTLAGGTVRVAVTSDGACDGDGDARPRVRIAVQDTGIGMPPEQLEAAFAPFVQVHATGPYTRSHDGTGLGLTVSRALARGMGGDLEAVSTPGTGSVFTLVLKRAVGDTGGPTDRRRAAHDGGGERRRVGERRGGDDRRHGTRRREDAASTS